MRRAAPIAALCLLAACGSDNAPQAARTVTATPPAAPRGTTVRFVAGDGKRLRGRMVPAAGPHAPGLVLVHQSDGGPEQWNAFIPYARQAGYAVLAYRSRGSGELNEELLARDVRGALAALRRQPGVDRSRLAIVGASIGANAALEALARIRAPWVRTAVGLSPGPPIAALPRPRRRALLIADANELRTAKLLAEEAEGRITVRRAPLTGHGIDLLPDARVRALVFGWLARELRA